VLSSAAFTSHVIELQTELKIAIVALAKGKAYKNKVVTKAEEMSRLLVLVLKNLKRSVRFVVE